jgi:L-iditol 2-dehydrogenase
VQAAFIRGIRDVAVGDLAEPEPTGDELLIEVEAVGICGSIVLVGIPEGDGYALQASLARRKGLGVRFSRRMGHVYPRAIELVRRGQVDVRRIATHPFPLAAAPEAFARQAERSQGIIKGMLHPDGRLPAG